MKYTLALLVLAFLCGCSQPTPPSTASPSAAPSATPNSADMTQIQGESLHDFTVVPFGGLSKQLEGLLRDKAAGTGGAFVPLVDASTAGIFLIGRVPGVTPEQLDSRPELQHNLKVSGRLQAFEDAATIQTVEKMMGQKWLQREGKCVLLELSADPWPVAAAPTPKGTP